jgi:hypothetical protein
LTFVWFAELTNVTVLVMGAVSKFDLEYEQP